MSRSNSQSSNSNISNPMASARDRLHASARDLFRNLEEAMSKKDSIESVMRVMFGSCSGAATTLNEEDMIPKSQQVMLPVISSTSNSDSSQQQRKGPQKPEYAEHIYAQLFFDDQIRAAKSDKEPPAQLRTETPRPLPKPFPVSSPPRDMGNTGPSQELNIPANLTFDDSISAISAHTLEAMAQTSRPIIEPVIREEPSFTPSPALERDRTWNSKLTKNSHSTQTTQSSSSFEHMWQKNEQTYWQHEARRSNSSYTSWKPSQHPHETLHLREAAFSEGMGEI